MTECPFEGGYDLLVGTSERGTMWDTVPHDSIPPFRHMLIVFGGLHGIESCVDGDDAMTHLEAGEADKLFDLWVNTCPGQGSRTIRTEVCPIIAYNIMHASCLSRRLF
jgi:predicted SPOUT superfamily RNA methylase MTH1